MASRWVDSGIDWANLDLHKERTSWVIDELYRATKEKLSIIRYMSYESTSVEAWDFNAGIRDAEKIDEIITIIKAWLVITYDPNEHSFGEAVFYDHTADQSTWNTDFQEKPWMGAKWFDISVGGNFELLIGDLSLIRDWSIGSSRITSDLLSLIYAVLVGLEYAYSEFKRYLTESVPTIINTWDGRDTVFSTALAEYNADPGTLSNNTVSFIQQRKPSATYILTHSNTNVGSSADARDSSGILADISSDDFKTIYFYEAVNGATEFSSFTYLSWANSLNVGGVSSPGAVAFPFTGFSDTGGTTYNASARGLQKIVPLSETLVKYYTP